MIAATQTIARTVQKEAPRRALDASGGRPCGGRKRPALSKQTSPAEVPAQREIPNRTGGRSRPKLSGQELEMPHALGLGLTRAGPRWFWLSLRPGWNRPPIDTSGLFARPHARGLPCGPRRNRVHRFVAATLCRPRACESVTHKARYGMRAWGTRTHRR